MTLPATTANPRLTTDLEPPGRTEPNIDRREARSRAPPRLGPDRRDSVCLEQRRIRACRTVGALVRSEARLHPPTGPGYLRQSPSSPLRGSGSLARWCSSSGPGTRSASTRVAARPREREPGALAGCRRSGRRQAHRRLPQSRQRRAAGLADHDADRRRYGDAHLWRISGLAHHSGESPAFRLMRYFCDRGLEQRTAAMFGCWVVRCGHRISRRGGSCW